MNWLAHLHLSENTPAARIGNLLPDILKFPDLATVPDCFRSGIDLHKRVDVFTDAHPVFRRSTKWIDGDLKRYAPILVDLFYDHFLCRSWHKYSDIPLDSFVDGFHAEIDVFKNDLPEIAYDRLSQIRDEGLLLSYQHLDGILSALERIGKRFKRPVDLTRGVDLLIKHDEGFAADFEIFYPELMRETEIALRE
jgi:acyl carrier protein phosphodiesterase